MNKSARSLNMPSPVKIFITLLLLATSFTPLLADESTSDIEVLFEPETAFSDPIDDEVYEVVWFTNSALDIHRLEVVSESTYNARITNYSQPMTDINDLAAEVNESLFDSPITYHGAFNMTILRIGTNKIKLYFFDKENNSLGVVTRNQTINLPSTSQTLTRAFSIGSACFVAILYFFMGASLDLEIVKGIVKKPVGPVLGILCQYGIMPTLAFSLGLAFFRDDFNLRLGLFLAGCCPGGGQSNMWTHLLGGSLDLSVMMTTVSMLCAFATVPMWVLTVGPIIAEEGNFEIPFVNIVTTVVSLICPCVLGIIAQLFFPNKKKYAQKLLSPCSAIILTYTFSFGVYSYLYCFELMTWKTLLAGFLQPFLGYVLGFTMAKLFCQSIENAIAIGIETGIQNATIAIIILEIAIPKPVSNIATVIPATTVLFTPVPLFIILCIKKLYTRFRASKKVDITDAPSPLKVLPESNDVSNDKPTDTEKNGIANPAADLRDVI